MVAEQPVRQVVIFLRFYMSGFMMSAAVNFAVVLILFLAAVLMTMGMLGM
jgi:hypothetical protein